MVMLNIVCEKKKILNHLDPGTLGKDGYDCFGKGLFRVNNQRTAVVNMIMKTLKWLMLECFTFFFSCARMDLN